jgi:hypothetical protein
VRERALDKTPQAHISLVLTDEPSPAQLLAWNKLWRRLLDGTEEGKEQASSPSADVRVDPSPRIGPIPTDRSITP